MRTKTSESDKRCNVKPANPAKDTTKPAIPIKGTDLAPWMKIVIESKIVFWPAHAVSVNNDFEAAY